MVSPEKIFDQADKRYFKVLSAFLKGDALPLDFKMDKSYLKLSAEEFRNAVSSLIQSSSLKRPNSYSIELKKVNTRQFGTQSVPSRIYFKSLNDYINTLGKELEFGHLQRNVSLIKTNFPNLKLWVEANPRKIIVNQDKWPDIIHVLKFLDESYERDRFYVRELPVKVHTKFIEENKAIIDELFAIVVPQKYYERGSNFYERLGLKEPAQLVRIRYLDSKLFWDDKITDLTFTLDEFKNLAPNVSKVFILENLLNFISFPEVKDAIVIWGKGFEVEKLKYIEWLNGKEIYYWGDLDTYGLAILSQLREFYPAAISLFMNLEDIYNYHQHGVEFIDKKERHLPGLRPAELSAYKYLSKGNIRIEQEKIPQRDLIQLLRKLHLLG